MQRIKERSASLFPIYVAVNIIRHAYNLAKEAIVSQLSRLVNPPRQAKDTRKTTCGICLDDDINANHMFCVNKCRHRFCYVCMKKHIEVRLQLEGSVVRCPQYRCKSKLTFGSCVDLLTPKLRKMWRQNIKQDSIPVKQRIYCPNPRCSALMSLKDLSKSTKEAGVWKYFFKSSEEARVRRQCFECAQLFCINCKVPWHSELSCDDCERLDPNPTALDIKFKELAKQNMWRQCGKCKHMIELAGGCIKVTCRCGNKFCYQCGAKAGDCRHEQKNMPSGFTRSSISPELCCSLYFKGLVGEDSSAGVGVAIYREEGDLWLQLNGPIRGSNITVLVAELTALKRGLMEAASLGIDHAGN